MESRRPFDRPRTEFLTVDVGGGVTLDGCLIKPRDFDGAKKYPVIVYVYGEPAAQTVVDRWGGNRALFHHALANEGYVVASFDNRGTPAPRGVAWRKVVYGVRTHGSTVSASAYGAGVGVARTR